MALRKIDLAPVPIEIPLNIIDATEMGIQNSHRRQILATDTISKPTTSKAPQLLYKFHVC